MSLYSENPLSDTTRIFGLFFLIETQSSNRDVQGIRWLEPLAIGDGLPSELEEPEESLQFQVAGELTPSFMQDTLSPYLKSLTNLQHIIDSLRHKAPSRVIIREVMNEQDEKLLLSSETNLEHLSDQARKMQEALSSQSIVVENKNHKIVMTGDQDIELLEISNTPNNELRELINKAIEKSRQLAAEKLLTFTSLRTSLTEFNKLRDEAVNLRRALSEEVIEVAQEGYKVVIKGDQTVEAIEIEGIQNNQLTEILNKAIGNSQELAAKQLITFTQLSESSKNKGSQQ